VSNFVGIVCTAEIEKMIVTAGREREEKGLLADVISQNG
jgi:hypothetical protein